MVRHDTENPPGPNGRPLSQQPAWRKDFPIDWPQDHYVARRDFTKFMVLTSLAFVVGQFWIAAQNFFRRRRGVPPIRKIATIDQVPVGATLPFRYPAENDTCLLLRPDANTLVAFSQKCTHLSCAVVPDHRNNCLSCPCHEGFFDITTGRPTAGPPRRPLPKITLQVKGEEIYATGVEEGLA